MTEEQKEQAKIFIEKYKYEYEYDLPNLVMFLKELIDE